MVNALDGAAGGDTGLREQLTSFRPLLALSMVMTSSRDETEILRIAASAVPSLGGCRAEAVYLDGEWRVVGLIGCPANADGLRTQLAALDVSGGPVEVQAAGWAWAYSLADHAGLAGYLVVSRDTEPESYHHFLLNVLAQQATVALVNARLHARECASAERERQTAARERKTAEKLRARAWTTVYAMRRQA